MQWEYLIFTLTAGDDELERNADRYGAEGWELVAVSGSTHYFKRPKEDPVIKTEKP